MKEYLNVLDELNKGACMDKSSSNDKNSKIPYSKGIP